MHALRVAEVEQADDMTLARARRGDRKAQAAVLRLHQGAVHRLIARMMVAHPELVEDLAQDSLLKVVEALPRFDPAGPAKLSTWILTIATRVAIDALRKHARIRALPEELAPADGPEELARARELESRVKQAMSDLPPDQRAVLVLRAYHDLDYPEIAAALEVEVGTVKSRLSRARAQLRRVMEERRRHGS